MKGPHIDWAAMSPLVALTAGACLVLMVGLLRSRFVRTRARAGAHAGDARRGRRARRLAVGREHVGRRGRAGDRRPHARAADGLRVAGVGRRAAVVALAGGGRGGRRRVLRAAAVADARDGRARRGARTWSSLFLGFELLSIPLYVLCATQMRREHSLESGLKYLIIGSVGSAMLLYGLALLYGATGSTDFAEIAAAVGDVRDDPLFLTALALIVAGLAFKASVAPFHQWTPDVYEGAPTPITAFMAVATKAAAFGVLLRLFDTALIGARDDWAPALAALAVVDDRDRQRRRDRAVVAQADARLLVGRAGGLHAGRRRGLDAARRLGGRLLPVRLRADEPRRVRGDRRARARDRPRATTCARCTGSAPTARGSRGR